MAIDSAARTPPTHTHPHPLFGGPKEGWGFQTLLAKIDAFVSGTPATWFLPCSNILVVILALSKK